MSQKLRQPVKFAHNSLKQNQQTDNNPQKTKQISKLHDRKVINKKNEPSAIRLQAINDTFHKIEQKTDSMIETFKIDKKLFQKLLDYKQKVKCNCPRSIKYYCLKCQYKNPELQFPLVNLPLNVKVIHHSSQKVNKSSIIPMKLLSQQITLQMFSPHQNQQNNNLLKQVEQQGTYILFPHKQSRKLQQFSIEQTQKIQNIIVLDCTWFQTDLLVNTLSKKGFNKYIRLQNYQSLYWRYNHHSDQALSSGQALTYFLRERQQKIKQKGEGEVDVQMYDNIMLLYCLNLKIVEQNYQKQGKAHDD